MQADDFEVHFKEIKMPTDEADAKIDDLWDMARQLFEEVLEEFKKQLPIQAHGRFVFTFPAMQYPMSFRFARLHDFDATDVLKQVEEKVNSNETLNLEDGFKVNLIVTGSPTGRGAQRFNH